MRRPLKLPDTASVAVPDENGRLFAPSAARNASAIAKVVAKYAPQNAAKALEIASGTGQHVIQMAEVLPDCHWQPTDLDPDRLSSINAYIAQSGATNIAQAVALDAAGAGWSRKHSGMDFVQLVNLLHLIPGSDARTVIQEAAIALNPGGRLLVYGPFMRDGKLTSEGDATFHESLQAQDDRLGYKDTADVVDWGEKAGLFALAQIEMPANNLALVWEKPAKRP